MPDEPITDLTHIEQTSKANEQENQEFRAYVRGDLDLSDYRLHGIVKEATEEVWSHIDCRTCANCCKTRHPVFSRTEVQRIAEYLGMTAAELRAAISKWIRRSPNMSRDSSPARSCRITCARSTTCGPQCAPATPISTATSAIGSGRPSITPKPVRSCSTCSND